MRKIPVALAIVVLVASLATKPQAAGAGGALLTGAQVPPDVLARLDAACRDCHSNATRYPWYSYIAPISMLVQHDVKEGRQHLNLSQWHEYSSVRRQRALSEIANQVQDGGMPLPIYTRLHSEAILTEADKALIFDWTQAERARLIAERIAK